MQLPVQVLFFFKLCEEGVEIGQATCYDETWLKSLKYAIMMGNGDSYGKRGKASHYGKFGKI